MAMTMIIAAGKSILNGIAIGKLKYYKLPEIEISDSEVIDPERELQTFEEARQNAIDEQKALYEKAKLESGEDTAQIFEIHAMMLDDDDFVSAIREIIVSEHKNAVYAVRTACLRQAEIFSEMDDPYFKARSADVEDICQSMLDSLTDRDRVPAQGTEPSILLAEDLAPSEMIRLDKSLLLGFVTMKGSVNSHTAILARSMNIPALVKCPEVSEEWDGREGIIDGYNSCIYIDPAPELLSTLTARRDEDLKKTALMQELKGKDNTTIDGTTVRVYANISGPWDTQAVLQNDAGGVGLFRTEFVYIGARDYPSEDEQFLSYRQVLETLSPKEVIFRTCDIGADKTVDYMQMDPEENPALGCRAIRICLMRKDFFKTQLRAILRASAYGTLLIMFPMITSARELREAKDILEECRQELVREGRKIGKYQIGTMIETPAAVMIADELAEECDFFSIGTNDLTQYTCAIDRTNAKLEPFSDTHHPAVLREIQMTVEAGHRHGIWVGICGELAADVTLTETFLRMGVDELSVNPKNVLPLRKIIRGLNLKEPKEI